PATAAPAASTSAATASAATATATAATASATATASGSLPRPARPRPAPRRREAEDPARALRGRAHPPRPLEAIACRPRRQADPEATGDQAPRLSRGPRRRSPLGPALRKLATRTRLMC